MEAATTIIPLQLPLWIELIAVAVGALAGATVAVEERFDVLGLLFLAVLMGVGGGLIRDILLGLRPVALSDPAYLPTALVAGIAGVVLAQLVGRTWLLWIVLDAFALGLFMLVGVEKSLLNGLAGPASVFIGVSAAVGGGVLRDVVSDRPVELVRRGTWNGAAALIGAILYVVLADLGLRSAICEALAIATVVTIRLFSIWRGWETPGADRLAKPITLPRRQYPRPGD